MFLGVTTVKLHPQYVHFNMHGETVLCAIIPLLIHPQDPITRMHTCIHQNPRSGWDVLCFGARCREDQAGSAGLQPSSAGRQPNMINSMSLIWKAIPRWAKPEVLVASIGQVSFIVSVLLQRFPWSYPRKELELKKDMSLEEVSSVGKRRPTWRYAPSGRPNFHMCIVFRCRRTGATSALLRYFMIKLSKCRKNLWDFSITWVFEGS